MASLHELIVGIMFCLLVCTAGLRFKREDCLMERSERVVRYFNNIMNSISSNIPETKCCFDMPRDLDQFQCQECVVENMQTLTLTEKQPIECSGTNNTISFKMKLKEPKITCDCDARLLFQRRKGVINFQFSDVEASGQLVVDLKNAASPAVKTTMSISSINRPRITVRECAICRFRQPLLNMFSSGRGRRMVSQQLKTILEEVVEEKAQDFKTLLL
ncbi:uncharacterized protein LOC111085778 [Limulus polyphemus]|uniref:Uncharacterized protein LOC111085778 n=1 Tax=Limulus polyphemus TaxID=6850 RepID=A0ABM1SDH7_LIMPO|nr:uncharacterized protein LOC111085778 [Limulus polyphemus]